MIRKNFLLFSVLSLIFACSDNDLVQKKQRQNDAISVENGRLVFKNIDEFRATISQLSQMDNAELTNWRSQFEFKSMNNRLEDIFKVESPLADDELEYSMLPLGYLNVLNSKGEVKIGDDIVWYNNGTKYYTLTEADLSSIKLNPSRALRTAEYKVFQVDMEGDHSNANNARYLKWSHGEASKTYTNQYEFTSSCIDTKRRKYVDHLYSLVDDRFPYDSQDKSKPYIVYLYIKYKLEYKNPSGDWATSAALRKNQWNFHADIVSKDVRGNVSTVSQTFAGTSYLDTYTEILLMEDVKKASMRDDGFFDWGWHEITIVGTMNHALAYGQGPVFSICNEWSNVW